MSALLFVLCFVLEVLISSSGLLFSVRMDILDPDSSFTTYKLYECIKLASLHNGDNSTGLPYGFGLRMKFYIYTAQGVPNM